MKITGPTNPLLRKQIEELASHKSLVWQRLASELGKARRNKRVLNFSDLQRHTKSGETVLLLGKLLATGILKNKLTIAVWNSRSEAHEAVKISGSSIISISELIKKNPKGTGIKVLG